MGWHTVGRTLVLLSRLRIRREGVVRGPAGRGRLDEAVVEWDLRVVVGDCGGLQVRRRAPRKALSYPSPLTLSAHLPVTQGSLWLLREPQCSAEPRLASAPQTWTFILDTAAPSLAGLRAQEGGQCVRFLVGGGWWQEKRARTVLVPGLVSGKKCDYNDSL